MAHSELRAFALTGQAEQIRAYAAEIRKDSARHYVADALELMALIAQSDFVGADSFQETLRFTYSKSDKESYIEQITALASTYISFVFGRFHDARKFAQKALTIKAEPVEIEPNDRLALKRVLAEIAFVLDDFDELAKIFQEVSEGSYEDDDKNQAHYFINCIKALYQHSQGDFKRAHQIAVQNVEIAKREGYRGIAHDLSSQIVRARSLTAMAQPEAANELLVHIREASQGINQWPWYFLAGGLISRDHAINNQMAEALGIVRNERELLNTFTFANELDIFPDINELFVRYMLQDTERMEVLLARVPDFLLVRQIRAVHQEWKGKDPLTWINELSETSPREQLYKYIAYAEYYRDQESTAIEYARKALVIAEQTHSIEFILRQHKIFPVFMKATLKNPTAFTENISRAIAERTKTNDLNKKGELMEPLTNRELEVVKHLATGKPISAIASTLHVSLNTMKTHLRNTYRKLEVDGRDGAVAKAKELFLI